MTCFLRLMPPGIQAELAGLDAEGALQERRIVGDHQHLRAFLHDVGEHQQTVCHPSAFIAAMAASSSGRADSTTARSSSSATVAVPPDEGGDEDVEAPASERRVAARGSVNVAARGGWAELYVDGQHVGRTPRSIPLAAGRHVIELRRDGEGTLARRFVTVRAGRMQRVLFEL